MNEVNSELKGLIHLNQDKDRERISALAILSDDNKKQLAEAVKYTNYYPDPITKDFQRKYILSDLEFATEESKLAQSVTELNVRTDNLMNDAYQFKKTELEIEKLKVERNFKLGELAEPEYKKQLGVVEADLLTLEIANKEVSLRKIELQSNNRFNEAMAWKSNVEDSLKKLGKESIDEVDLNQVRMGLMRAKIKSWGELYVEGSFEMTPSKLQAIKSEEKSFNDGVNEGMAKLINMNPEMAKKRAKELGIEMVSQIK